MRSALGSVHELPAALPDGEHVVWQGSPSWWALARSLHIKLVTVYMVVLLGWYVGDGLWHGEPAPLLHIARMSAIAILAVVLFASYAFLVCWSTSYTATNRRLIIQSGIALPISFNIPFSILASIDWRASNDDSGDIVLSLEQGNKIGYLAIWPHARPWQLSQVHPMLRAIPQVKNVAGQLARLVDLDSHAVLHVHAATSFVTPTYRKAGAYQTIAAE